MESLESKLDRLNPEQRKNVEDFVDFLIFRSGNSQESQGTAETPQPPRNVAPPPLTLSEQVPFAENLPIKLYDSHQNENVSSAVKNEDQVKPLQEIIVDGADRITRDYMDYGQFEQTPSPATIAVKNVKEKLQKREGQEKPKVPLDWID
jgi:hypothetical protein